jgi:translation initiation factor 1A
MPNLQGGKKYKSSKHGETQSEFHEINAAEGQMVGRIIRNFGNRNMMVYCNDGKERMCHIRGGLKKKVACVEVGDIVLVSLREEGLKLSADSGSSSKDRGDILAKYERDVHKLLKKMEGINIKLFSNLETLDGKQRSRGVEVDDFGFTFEQGEESENEEDEEGLNKEEIKLLRANKKAQLEKKRAAARNTKMDSSAGDGGGPDVDIDAI